MSQIELVGFVAGFLTAGSFLPQVLKTWRTHSTKDISLGMFVVYVFSTLLWIVYGYLIESGPVMAANGAILVMATFILIMKIKYK
ncbi:MAG: SemiSWEET transporter [Magnetococcales bacterium]|nr:SemiSWEET transporter [Magnetococcales bacterium]